MWWACLAGLTGAAGAGEPDVDVSHLANGMVLVVESTDDPTVSLRLRIRAGTRHERAGEEEVAHIVEHLWFEGPTLLGDGHALRALEVEGNGATTADYTDYIRVVQPEALEVAVAEVAARLMAPDDTGLAHRLEVAKAEVWAEREGYRGRDWGWEEGSLSIRAALAPDDPYQLRTGTALADLDDLTVADVVAFRDTYYTPEHIVLGVSGPVDAQAVSALVETWLGPMPSGGRAPFPLVPPPREEPRHIEATVPGRTTTLVRLSWALPGIDHPDSAALEVAACVRERDAWMNLHRGVALDAVEVPEDEVAAYLTRLRLEATTMPRRPVPGATLRACRDELAEDLLWLRFLALDRTEVLLDCWQAFGDPSCWEARIDAYQAVEEADVQRVEEKWLAVDRAGSLVARPGASFSHTGGEDLTAGTRPTPPTRVQPALPPQPVPTAPVPLPQPSVVVRQVRPGVRLTHVDPGGPLTVWAASHGQRPVELDLRPRAVSRAATSLNALQPGAVVWADAQAMREGRATRGAVRSVARPRWSLPEDPLPEDSVRRPLGSGLGGGGGTVDQDSWLEPQVDILAIGGPRTAKLERWSRRATRRLRPGLVAGAVGPEVVCHDTEGTRVQLVARLAGPAPDAPEAGAFDVLTHILGGHMDARLREDHPIGKGASYLWEDHLARFAHTWSYALVVGPDAVPAVMAGVERHIADLAKDGPTEPETRRAHQQRVLAHNAQLRDLLVYGEVPEVDWVPGLVPPESPDEDLLAKAAAWLEGPVLWRVEGPRAVLDALGVACTGSSGATLARD